jgi:hypothetical protein
MTWWAGGRVRVVLPQALLGDVGATQLRWILAHELAHVSRRDHLVRWLEWTASVVGWWNPVVWWARRSLRQDEEDACDALVLARVQGGRRTYARTLLAVTELLSRPPVGQPALATGIDAARSLEHRLVRIVRPGRTRSAPRAMTVGLVGAALLLMLGGVQAMAASAPSVGAREPADVSAIEPVDAAAATRTPGAEAGVPSYAEVSARVPAASLVDGSLTRRGTAAADAIIGGDQGEVLIGLDGDDRLGGGPGPDVIHGGAGDDTIRGGRGADVLGGGAGHDVIGGGAGDDTIRGGAGDDDIQGGAGRDMVEAGAGNDTVRTWADGTPDQVDCGSGDDRAVIDSTDTAERCEVVLVRDAS